MVVPQPGAPANPFLSAPMPASQLSFDRSIGDTWNNIHAFQVFDGGISKSKATADAHRYDFVWGTSKPSAWKTGNSKILTSWYAPFDGDFTTRHNLTWWKANHPDWVLYKCDKKTPANLGGLTNVPLDISNPAIAQWQMTTYAPTIENGGYDALALDLVGLNNANRGCGVWINGVWVARFTGQIVDDTWTKAVLAWHQYAYSYLHGLSRPILVAVNNVPENRSFGDPEQNTLMNNVDIVDDESSFTNYGNSYASTAKVILTLQWMKYVQGLGKTWIVDDKWNVQKMSPQQFLWGLSTYLLGKYHHASVFIDHQPGYGYEYWYSQYTATIGTPCGDFYQDPINAGVFYRKYSGAFVVVNSTISHTYTLNLPLPTYTDIYGNPIASPLTLSGDNAEVLLTTLNGCL